MKYTFNSSQRVFNFQLVVYIYKKESQRNLLEQKKTKPLVEDLDEKLNKNNH